MPWYHLTTTKSDSCTPSKEWRSLSRGKLFCDGCGTPLRRDESPSVPVQNKPRASLTFVQGFGVGIIHEDLLAAVPADELRVGPLLAANGQPYGTYRTFIVRRRLFIRGDERSSHRWCDQCGALVYFPMGDRHLVGEPVGGPVFEDQFHSLVVDHEVARAIRALRLADIVLHELPVRGSPSDGLEPTLPHTEQSDGT